MTHQAYMSNTNLYRPASKANLSPLPVVMIGRSARFILTVFAALLFGLVIPTSPVQAGDQPRLVLQITFDALRGDLPQRFANVFGEGGLR